MPLDEWGRPYSLSSPAPAAGARVALASRVKDACGDRWSDWLEGDKFCPRWRGTQKVGAPCRYLNCHLGSTAVKARLHLMQARSRRSVLYLGLIAEVVVTGTQEKHRLLDRPIPAARVGSNRKHEYAFAAAICCFVCIGVVNAFSIGHF